MAIGILPTAHTLQQGGSVTKLEIHNLLKSDGLVGKVNGGAGGIILTF